MLVKNASGLLVGEKEICDLVPGFDWFELSEVLSICLVLDVDGRVGVGSGFDVDVVAACGGGLVVGFRLVGVVQLVLPKIVWPGGLDLGELEVSDVRSRQMEGINYVLQDVGVGSFRCECRDIVFTSVSRRSQDGLLEVWRNALIG